MVIDSLLRVMQQFCRHDYECLGRYAYILSGTRETVWFCNRCATTLAATRSSDASHGETTTFTYRP